MRKKRIFYSLLVILLVGCADTQGPIERSNSVIEDWKEFGNATYEDITE